MRTRGMAGLGYAVLAVLFFATSPVLVRWAAPLSSFEIAFGRLATAALVVFLVEKLSSVVAQSAKRDETPRIAEAGLPTRIEPPSTTSLSRFAESVDLRLYARFAVYGLIAALHFLFYVASLDFTTIAHSLALVYTAPVFVTLFSAVLLKERIRPRQWLGFPIVIVGIAILSGIEPSLDDRMLLGDLLALASAVCFGLYSIAGRRERTTMPLLRYAGLVYLFAALWLLPVAVIASTGSVEARSIAAVIALGVFPLAIGHTLYNASIRRVHPTYVNVVSTQEVTGGVLLGYLLLGEVPSASSFVGGGLSLLGVLLVLLL